MRQKEDNVFQKIGNSEKSKVRKNITNIIEGGTNNKYFITKTENRKKMFSS